MSILFDECVPRPLRRLLPEQRIRTTQEMGWSRCQNGELLALAEPHFGLLVTTDKNLRYQQNLTGRRIAILVLPTTDWTVIRPKAADVAAAIAQMQPGEFRELSF